MHQQSMSEQGQGCFEDGNNWLPCSIRGVKQLVNFFMLYLSLSHGTIKKIQSAFEIYKGLECMNT